MTLSAFTAGSDDACGSRSVGAAGAVDSGIERFEKLAEDTIDNTNTALSKLKYAGNVNGYNATAGVPATFLLNFTPPGSIPTYDSSVKIPDYNVPPFSLIDLANGISDYDFPEFIKESPAFNAPTKPGDLDAKKPGEAPPINNQDLPPVPTITDVEDPVILPVSVTPLPLIDIPLFSAQPPSSTGITPPGNTFNWEEGDYNSALLVQTQSAVSNILNGGVGIPEEVWNAIWEKGVEREDRSATKLNQQVHETFAARGFPSPVGAQEKKVQEAQQAVQDASNTLSREIAEKRAEHEIENLKFAIQQGIALEGMLGGWYQQKLTRLLDAAKFSYQAEVELFNAQITLFNAQMELYSTEASVYKALLESAAIELEIYRTELEGQKLINDINAQSVQLYVAQVNALGTYIDLYNAQLQGVKTLVDIDVANLDAYKTEVQAYGEIVRAKGIEYDGYKTQLDGEKVKADIYSTEVQSYIGRIEGIKTKAETENLRVTADISINELRLREFEALMQDQDNRVKNALSEIDVNVKKLQSDTQIYDINVKNEQSRVSTILDASKTAISFATQETQVSIANATNQTEASKAEAANSVESAKAIAAINGQIAAGAMSAVNLSAGISDSASNGSTCSTSQ